TYGTFPRNFLRGPGYINFDLAFAKTTAITERLKLEFRAEFFNIFNHANFLDPRVINNGDGTFAGGAPGANINSAAFGQVTGTYDPRIIQFGLRLSFYAGCFVATLVRQEFRRVRVQVILLTT